VIVKENGSLWIYASACTREHGNILPGIGSITAYSLRRDGFVFLESTGGAGVVGTRAVYWKGGEAMLNIQSQGGEARVQVMDAGRRIQRHPNRYKTSALEGYTFADCEPFAGDDTSWTPVWKNGKRLEHLSGRAIRLEVRLDSARLFAIRGDLVVLTGRRYRRFLEDGTAPEPRTGF